MKDLDLDLWLIWTSTWISLPWWAWIWIQNGYESGSGIDSDLDLDPKWRSGLAAVQWIHDAAA